MTPKLIDVKILYIYSYIICNFSDILPISLLFFILENKNISLTPICNIVFSN